MCIEVSPLVLEPRVRAPTIPWKNVYVEPLCARLSFLQKSLYFYRLSCFFSQTFDVIMITLLKNS